MQPRVGAGPNRSSCAEEAFAQQKNASSTDIAGLEHAFARRLAREGFEARHRIQRFQPRTHAAAAASHFLQTQKLFVDVGADQFQDSAGPAPLSSPNPPPSKRESREKVKKSTTPCLHDRGVRGQPLSAVTQWLSRYHHRTFPIINGPCTPLPPNPPPSREPAQERLKDPSHTARRTWLSPPTSHCDSTMAWWVSAPSISTTERAKHPPTHKTHHLQRDPCK